MKKSLDSFFCVGAVNRTLALSGLTLAAIVLASVSPEAMANGMKIPASGQSLGEISNNVTASLRGASVLVTALAYLGALVFGFMGALKWKAYGEQPDRTPLKVPVTYMAIAAILAALPEFLGTGIATIWGQDATVIKQP